MGAGEEPPGRGAAVEIQQGLGGFAGAVEIVAVELIDRFRVELIPAGGAVAVQPDGRLARLPIDHIYFWDHHNDRYAHRPGDLGDDTECRVRPLPEPFLRLLSRALDSLLS